MGKKKRTSLRGTPKSTSPSPASAKPLSIQDFGMVKNPTESFRKTLVDVAKDYKEHDVIVELLQNALDAIDQRRYELICNAAGVDAASNKTVDAWNTVIQKLIEDDYTDYANALKKKPCEVQVAALYTKWKDDKTRRTTWWQALAKAFGSDADTLRKAVSPKVYTPVIIVSYSRSRRLFEVQDNGVGMDLSRHDSVLDYFRHTESNKRDGKKRLGVRGSHGWGLSAVLAYTNTLNVYSKVRGADAVGWEFRGFRDFRKGGKEPIPVRLDPSSVKLESSKGCLATNHSGTMFQVSLSENDEDSNLQYVLTNYTVERFINYLRLFTPIAQVNDYVLHPAYHCYRKADNISVTFRDLDMLADHPVTYSLLEFSEVLPAYCHGYDNFVARPTGLRGHSVHTVHRYRSTEKLNVLTAAEVQQTDRFQEFVDAMKQTESLPCKGDDPEGESLWRGFYLALSGGLLCAAEVQGVKGNDGNFRGIALAEDSPPTLARKEINEELKGNTVIPKAARAHTNHYNDCRKLLKPASGGASQIKLYKERKKLFDDLIKQLAAEPTMTGDLYTWAPKSSGEARVMLLFAEFLSRKDFGDLRILTCGLRDTYDFAFLYRTTVSGTSIPGGIVAAELEHAGLCDYTTTGPSAGAFVRLGIGEFKAEGESILRDFNPAEPLKNADAIDLLVCWAFDEKKLEDKGWDSEKISSDAEREFPNQTHKWSSQAGAKISRARSLAVISLAELIDDLAKSKKLVAPAVLSAVTNYYS